MLDFSITLQRMSVNSNTNYPPSRTLLQFKYYWPNFKQILLFHSSQNYDIPKGAEAQSSQL